MGENGITKRLMPYFIRHQLGNGTVTMAHFLLVKVGYIVKAEVYEAERVTLHLTGQSSGREYRKLQWNRSCRCRV